MTLNLLNQLADSQQSQTPEQSPTPQPVPKPVVPANASLFADSDGELAVTLRPQFWSRFALSELTHHEWEALCDGCGSCCLIKYIDDDDAEALVEYTDVTCQLMDCATGHCQHYATRQEYVPDCIQLTMENLPNMMWLPSHCAYKRLYKGQELPSWHLLLTGDAARTEQQMRAANVGVAGRCVSEVGMTDEEMEERVVTWVQP